MRAALAASILCVFDRHSWQSLLEGQDDSEFTFNTRYDLQKWEMANDSDPSDVARARELMSEALLLLDAAGITLAATHLEQALHLVSEELQVH